VISAKAASVLDQSHHFSELSSFVTKLNEGMGGSKKLHEFLLSDKGPYQRTTWLLEYLAKLASSPARPRNRFVEPAIGRAFFIDSDGRMGLAPASAVKGDDVCVLLGGPVPFILRQKKDHYKLVGESYVEGVMDGEALEHHRANLRELGHILPPSDNKLVSHAPLEEIEIR